jgi:protein TonB
MSESGDFSGPNAHFFGGSVAALPHPRTPAAGALGVSVLAHVVPLLLVGLVMGRLGSTDALKKVTADLSTPVTWIVEAGGPGGARIAGGKTRLERQRSSAKEFRTRTSAPEQPMISQSPYPTYDIPTLTANADLQAVPGPVSPLTAIARGDATPSGDGPGGGGTGTGTGPGNGPGPGTGDGGDPYHAGNGATSPTLIAEVKPGYTSDAMRARIQGTVLVRAVVLPDGSVGTARIVRSLDTAFGLDQEALKAVKLWRFRPGTLAGRAVAVPVEIEMTFTLR